MEKQGKQEKQENKDEYNGWKNYETWVTKLWIDNDEYSANYQQGLLKLAKDTVKNDPSEVLTHDENVCYELSRLLKDWVEGMTLWNNMDSSGLKVDLMNAAVSMIDFSEIAQAIIDDN